MIGSSSCIHKYGEPTPAMERKHMVLWDVPDWINRELPVIPNRIYCNRDMAEPLELAFINIIHRCLQDEVKTYDGCFNIRLVRGGRKWSMHSWGVAIDINAAWNGLGKEPQISAELVKCFIDVGFDWGGNWTRKDGMHFQLKSI